MKVNAEIINVVYYTSKKTNKASTWIRYRLLDPKCISNTDKLCGYSILDEYISNQDIKDSFKPEYCGVQCEIEYTNDLANPLGRKRIKSIKVGNDVVSVL